MNREQTHHEMWTLSMIRDDIVLALVFSNS
jgi:hypothetical protein